MKCKTSLLVDDCLIESQDGEVLFSDQGLSGICIMQLSRLLSRYDGKKEISLDLLPEYDYKQVEFLLNERKEKYGNYYLEGMFNDKLAKY